MTSRLWGSYPRLCTPDLLLQRLQIHTTALLAQRGGRRWTAAEDDQLLVAVKAATLTRTEPGKRIQWKSVVDSMESRTRDACIARYNQLQKLDENRNMASNSYRRRWLSYEDTRLKQLHDEYGSQWIKIAEHMPGRDRRSCRQRWVRCINPQLNRNEWAAEERRKLSIIVKHAKNRSNNDDISRVSWADVSRRLGGGRTDIQCKTEYLRVWNEKQLKQSRKRQHQQQHQLTSTSGGQKRGKFADDEISRLLQAVKMVFEDGYVGTNTRWKKVSEDTSPWQRVSSLVRTRTAEQCRAKVSYLLQQQQRHGGPTRRRHTDGLTDMEISRLVRAVAKHGRQWTLIARVYFPGKTGSWLSRQYTHYLNQLKKLEGSLDFDE